MPVLSDARSVRSQQALRQALLDLMQELPFDQITLRDIALRASVSYPTFYRHYATKDDLLADIAKGEILGVMSLPFRQSGPDPAAGPGALICAFVNQRRSLWTTLLKAGAMPVMREEFIRRGEEAAERGPRFNPRFPAEIMARIVAGGLFEIIAWWLQQDEAYPVEEIGVMLEHLVINPSTRPPRPRADR